MKPPWSDAVGAGAAALASSVAIAAALAAAGRAVTANTSVRDFSAPFAAVESCGHRRHTPVA